MSQHWIFGNLALDMASSFIRRKNSKYPGGLPYEKKTQKFSSIRRGRVFSRKKLSVVFMGTPEFACPSLQRLIEEENVISVVTQPNRAKGRGQRLHPPPVKVVAQKYGIPVYQPERIKDTVFLKQIKNLQPQLIVVVAFGKLLPPELLTVPALYAINVHPSLLPRYRGPAPVHRAIIRGERETGVTVQKMSQQIDAGQIISQRKIPINLEDTTGTLSFRLARIGAETLMEVLNLIKTDEIELKSQQGQVSYAPKISKAEARINWKRTACEIHNLVRGLNPYPGAFTTFSRGKKTRKLTIWRTYPLEDEAEKTHSRTYSTGTVVGIFKHEGFTVKTGKGLLLVKEVQLPGKSRIDAYDFVKGYHLKEGFSLE